MEIGVSLPMCSVDDEDSFAKPSIFRIIKVKNLYQSFCNFIMQSKFKMAIEID